MTAEPPIRRIAALILAAGRSTRMGRNKLLIPLDGSRMIERVAEAVLASRATPVIVVTGHEAEAVRATLRAQPVEFVHNPAYHAGLSTSLAAGIAALPDAVDGVVVCLGDVPGVSAAVIDRLIAAFDPDAGRAIVAPERDGKRGHPVLWGKQFFAALREVTGDTGGRGVLAGNMASLATIAVADDGVMMDIDTPEALAQYLADQARGGISHD
jgi:molybdenum cofactor cytidylyltransferase